MLMVSAHGDRCEGHPRRRATGDDTGWRGRPTDDDSASGASKKEPCPVALWFQDACADQAWLTPTLFQILSNQISCDCICGQGVCMLPSLNLEHLFDNSACAALTLQYHLRR